MVNDKKLNNNPQIQRYFRKKEGAKFRRKQKVFHTHTDDRAAEVITGGKPSCIGRGQGDLHRNLESRSASFQKDSLCEP